MRRHHASFFAALALISVWAFRPLGDPDPVERASGATRVFADTASVREHFLTGIEAFNAHDLPGFTEQFAEEIEMYTPTGWVRGHDAVRQRFAGTFEQFPRVRMEIDSLRVRGVGPATVLVDFRWRVFPMGAGPAFHGVGSGVYVQREGRWVEVLEHETVTRVDPELQPPPGP